MIAAILMIATNGVLSAQTTTQGNGSIKNVPGFVDVNKNGICDTYESNNQSGVKGAGQANRMNRGRGAGFARRNRQGGSPATGGRRIGNKCCRRE